MKTLLTAYYRLLHQVVIVLLAIAITIDFFHTNEFLLEEVFLVMILVVLLILFIRQSNQKIWQRKILGLIINFSLLFSSLFVFFFLFLTFWGYGFTGRHIPITWLSVTILYFAFFILTVIDLSKFILEKTPEKEDNG